MTLPIIGIFNRFVTKNNFNLIVDDSYFDVINKWIITNVIAFPRNRTNITFSDLSKIFNVYVFLRLAPIVDRLDTEWNEGVRIVHNYGHVLPLMQMATVLPDLGEIRVGPVVLRIMQFNQNIIDAKSFISSGQFSALTSRIAIWYKENQKEIAFGNVHEKYDLTVTIVNVDQYAEDDDSLVNSTIRTTSTERIHASLGVFVFAIFNLYFYDYLPTIKQLDIFFKFQATLTLSAIEQNTLQEWILYWFFYGGGCGSSKFKQPEPDFGKRGHERGSVSNKIEPDQRQRRPAPRIIVNNPKVDIPRIPNNQNTGNQMTLNKVLTSEKSLSEKDKNDIVFKLLDILVGQIKLDYYPGPR